MTWDRRLYFPSKGRCAEDFFALKIWQFRPGLNPRTWALKASTLPLDHRSRLNWMYFSIKQIIGKTGRCKSQRNLWKNMPVGWTCHQSQCLINGLLLWTTTVSDQCKQKYALYNILTDAQQNTQCSKSGVLDWYKDIQCFMALCVLDCQKQKQYWWCYVVISTEIHIVPELYVYLMPTATWSVSQLDVTPAGAIPNQIHHTNVGQIFNSNRAMSIWN